VHAEIGINWFLDREMPKGESYSRKNALVKQEQELQRPHYMYGAKQRAANCKQQLEIFTKAMVGPRTSADDSHPRGN